MVVTNAMLMDYLSQFPGDTEVVISLEDLGADATEERADSAISLTTAMDVLR